MTGMRVELVAVVMTVEGTTPRILMAGDEARLPSGSLASAGASLQAEVRDFVREQTGHVLGFVEQLYTFADGGRTDAPDREVSISYLGLTRDPASSSWRDLYDLLPWEDRRTGASAAMREAVDALREWSAGAAKSVAEQRNSRIDFLFGEGGQPWRSELALQRYELLWEAGAVAESGDAQAHTVLGPAMVQDHRRILATAVSRLRATLQYRPVVFELVPDVFTLGRLQEVVEALAGGKVHTQNFRRLVEQQHALVEPTGEVERGTGGRPARVYRFKRAVFTERDFVGTKLPLPRTR